MKKKIGATNTEPNVVWASGCDSRDRVERPGLAESIAIPVKNGRGIFSRENGKPDVVGARDRARSEGLRTENA